MPELKIQILDSAKNFCPSTAVIVLLTILCLKASSSADTYLRLNATYNDGRDTVGRVEHFLEFGRKIAVFIPPYTVNFLVYPLADSLYSAAIDFFELGPAYSNYHRELTIAPGKQHTIEDLPSKGMLFDYSFTITKDTANYLNPIPIDSLTKFETIHFNAFVWRSTYADYKWKARSAYLENIFNRYRKELAVTRAGKLNLYVLPGSNTSLSIDNYTGVGYDIAGKTLYTVFNRNFDSAIPQHTQRFIIYEMWGYSARMLVVGFSHYFFDDIYSARKLVSEMSFSEIKNILSNEFPDDAERADILSGAFVKFLIDQYGMYEFKTLYEKSSPGRFMFDDIYKKSFDELLRRFIDYEKDLELNESDASYYSDLYISQMWFDKALEYKTWLASQPINKEQHLRQLGAIYFQIGNYAESESCYTALADSQPDNRRIAYLKGLAYIRNGKTDQAIKELENIANDFPNAAKMLAEIYLDQRQFDKAQTALDKVKGIPDSWSAILKARLSLAQDKKARADTIINIGFALNNNVISLIPGEARGYINSAYLSMLKGMYEAAESELQIALFVDNRPYYLAAANLALGRLYDLQNDHKSAKIYYDKAIELNSGEYINALAKSYKEKPLKLR